MDGKRAILFSMRAFTILIILLSLACSPRAEAKKCNKAPLKIVVLDTGFGFHDQGHEANLCRYGHKDFTSDRQFTHSYATSDLVPLDVHGHGTNIVGIIDGYAKAAHVNYCIVIVKYYSDHQPGSQNLLATIRAFNYASNIHADYVNYSGGGYEIDHFERMAVKRFINHGGQLIAAAGNDNQNIDEQQNAYYPAMYDKRTIIVGNLGRNGVKLNSSNYGTSVNRWEVGENVSAFGVTMTGTSQATAIATGKIVAESSNKCDIGF